MSQPDPVVVRAGENGFGRTILPLPRISDDIPQLWEDGGAQPWRTKAVLRLVLGEREGEKVGGREVYLYMLAPIGVRKCTLCRM